MPVYGLPLSLEASLNSLVELRPPTSWRVSGRGDEVTVVLRWTLSGSPSSDKTLDYDLNPGPRPASHVATSSLYSRGIKRAEKLSPGADIKTRSSSVHDCRLTTSLLPKYDCLQPFKLRKLDTVSRLTPHSPSPVPVYITVADGTFPPSSPELHRKHHSLVCESVRTQHAHADSNSLGNHHPINCDSQRETQAETPGKQHLIPTNASPTADRENRETSPTHLTPRSTEVSLDVPSVTLDEKSGLFTDVQHLVVQPHLEVKVNSSKCDRPTLIDPLQNDSGCASESNSTSLSHYVKHTLSQDSSSQDGSRCKSASTSGSNQGSPSDNRCSSAGSSVSRSSLALQSCSSKVKMESVDSSNEDTNLMDEKDDDCHSQDLDMVCSNEVGHEQVRADSESSRSSISYWDSFDSLHSDPLPPEVEASEATSGQVTHNCLSIDNNEYGDFTV